MILKPPEPYGTEEDIKHTREMAEQLFKVIDMHIAAIVAPLEAKLKEIEDKLYCYGIVMNIKDK